MACTRIDVIKTRSIKDDKLTIASPRLTDPIKGNSPTSKTILSCKSKKFPVRRTRYAKLRPFKNTEGSGNRVYAEVDVITN